MVFSCQQIDCYNLVSKFCQEYIVYPFVSDHTGKARFYIFRWVNYFSGKQLDTKESETFIDFSNSYTELQINGPK